ncbi:MAG: MurR/RpiR family transcriptional regulator [Coprobacillus sp.]
MSLLSSFQKNSDSLSKLEVECFHKLIETETLDPNCTIASLADFLLVSTTTIFRMAKKLGYRTFMEFRYDLLYQRRETMFSQMSDDCVDSMQVIEKQISNTIDLLKSTDMKSIVEKISKASSVLICSTGMNNYIAKILAVKLSLMGIRTNYPEDQWFMYLEANNLKREDLVIVFSRDGTTDSLLDVIKNAKMSGNQVILITERKYSKMQELADYAIYVSTGVNEGYDIDTRLSMHIAIEYIMNELTKIIK